MRKVLWILLMFAVVPSTFAQSTSSKYQPGLIMSVKQHPEPASTTDSPKRYDIDIKVGNTIYSLLYTPAPGTYGFQYSAGQEILVSVGPKTITYNDMLGKSRTVPIVSRSTAPEKNVQ